MQILLYSIITQKYVLTLRFPEQVYPERTGSQTSSSDSFQPLCSFIILAASGLRCERFAFFLVLMCFGFFSSSQPAGELSGPHIQHYVRCVCEAWDFSALCFCFTSSPNRRSQIIHVVSRQGAAAASACGDSLRVCVRVCIMYIMQAGVLCETVCYASVCVCVCCNSHSKSKSLTAALMPAASQVMKGPLLVATDTSISPPIPFLPPG